MITKTKLMFLSALFLACGTLADAQVKDMLNRSKNNLKKAVNQQLDAPKPTTPANSQPQQSEAPAPTPAYEAPAPAASAAPASNIVAPKRAGQILFSSDVENLKKDAENEAGLSGKFALGAPIYFRAYYAMPLTDYMQNLLPDVNRLILSVHSRFKIRFVLDGKDVFEQAMQEEEFQNEWKDQWTSFKGALQPSGDEVYLVADIFRAFVSERGTKLTNGDHTIRMEILPYTSYPDTKEGTPAATGTFTLSVNESSIDPNNEKLCMPARQMADADLEAAIIKAFKAKGWPEQPQEVRIISPKWNIVRNTNTAVILKRTVDAIVASTIKGKCIAQEFSFAQDYDGADYQKEVYLYGTGSQRDINCKCIKGH